MRGLFLAAMLAAVAAPSTARAQCLDEPAGTAPLRAIGELASLPDAPAPVSHTVQRATLDEILRRVRATPRAVVQVDLDDTAFEPIASTRIALAALGRAYGLPELENPGALDELPAYTPAAFVNWLRDTGLYDRHPDVNWRKVIDGFDQIGRRLRGTETPTPGLADFVARVRDAGGEVVFNTGRAEAFRPQSLAVLARAGVADPKLVMRPDRFEGTIAQAKAAAQARIAAYGTTVAIVDDLEANREAVAQSAGGDVMQVAIALPGITTEDSAPELAARRWRISTFER